MGIWTPEAEWVGPSPNQSGRMIEQRGMVLHVMQGSLAGSISWGKNPSSGVSFHFGTRKSDGLVQQLVDTSITAWTQCNGNGRWISVENEDFSGNPLSDLQIESIAKLYARGVREYGWLLQITDDPNGRGLGWHGMGGVAWCNHPTCPGEPIKAQRTAILGRAAEILGGAVTSPAAVWDYMLTTPNGGQADAKTNLVYSDYYAWLSGCWSWQCKHLLLGMLAMNDPVVVPHLPPQFGEFPETQGFSVSNALAQAILAAGGGPGGIFPHIHEGGTTGPAVED